MKNSSKRAISRIVAFVMLVTCMFSNIMITNAELSDLADSVESGSAVETATYTFDATALTAAADKEVLTQDEVDSYFTVIGTIQKRTSSGSVISVELAKNDGGQISFTTTADSSDVAFDFSSTGSSNESSYALIDDSGAVYAEGTVVGASAGITTITATGLPAGTYTITSPDQGFNRGGRVYSITVVENGSIDTPIEDTTETTTTETTTAAQGGSDTPALGTPETGKTYSAEFSGSGVEAGTLVNGTLYGENTIQIVSPTDKAYFHDNSHGLALVDGDQINVAVAGKADVTLNVCQYGNGTVYTVTDSDGNELGTVAAKGASDGEAATFSYSGPATILTFTLASAGEAYLHSVIAKNAAAALGVAESFEFWLDDIATDVSEVDELTGETTVTKTVEPGVYNFADTTLELVGNGDYKFTPEIAAGQNILRAGKIVNAYKAGPRNANCNDLTTIPQQGDGTAVVFTPADAGMLNTYFYSTSFLRVWDFDTATGTRYGYVDSESPVDNFAFKAETGHTYVLSTTGKTNNCAFAGFEYVVDENIAVPVNPWTTDGKYNYDNVVVTLTDVALGTEAGTIKLDTTSITLAKGHTYSLTTNDGGAKATFAGEETYKVVDDTPITLAMEEVPDVTLTGKFVGADVSVVNSVKFTSMVSGAEYTATLTEDGYTAIVKPGEYNTTVDANGYYTMDRASVVFGEENINNIYLESLVKSKYVLPEEVAGNTALGLNGIVANNSTSVKGIAGDTVVIPVNGKQKVTVAGWYAGTWDINGQNSVTADTSSNASNPVTNTYVTDGTETSVTVNITGEGSNYLYWITVEDITSFDPNNTTITVPGDFDTLTEAVAYIRNMDNRPEGEEGRITISLAADIQEQVVFDAPYITLQGNGHEINWYYGQTVLYYSVGSDGLYSERLFQDKYSKTEGNGNLWGGVVIVRGDNFIAENTTFRNTFNYEVTAKELEDGAEAVDLSLGMRNAGDNVAAYKYKERSNAFYIEADNIECYNCKILSSQDTLGRNGSTDYGFHTYFKDCVIGGNVDYICGEFAAVFDNCELQWKTYSGDASNNAKIGYIVAPKTNPYVFRNCTVTTDGVSTDPVTGLYGRTWGANSNASFINTETNGLIKAEGWGEMTAGDALTATFYEYNNTENGYAFGPTTNGLALTDELIANYVDDDISTAIDTVLAGWTPVHYEFIPFEASTATTESTTETTTESTTEGTTAAPVDPVDPSNAVKYIPTADVLKDQVAFSDDNIEIVAAQDLTFSPVETSADKAIIANAGRDYTDYIVTNSVNTTLLVPGAEKGSSYRLMFAITAKNDMTVSIDNKVGKNNKENAVLSNLTITGTTESGDPSGTANVVTSQVNEDARYDAFSTLSFSLKAGETVYFAGKGTNPNLYSIMYTVGGDTPIDPSEDTTETSTEATTAETTETTTAENTETTTSATPVDPVGSLWGDVNDNGVVEANDAALTLQYVLNNATEMVVERADVSGNGVIDSEDAAMILQKALDSTYIFPVEENDEPVTGAPVLYVVGDSTGCHYAETADANYYYKRVGFGDKIGDYIGLEVENLALSGRSSKSFLTEANYETLKNNIKEGDFLLIAFGHNDEKSDDTTRYTAPGGTKDTEGSFKNSLYENYVKLAQDAGATPILCSPIVRRSADGTWGSNTLHLANNGDYANDVKELAEEVNVPFIDLTQLTKAKYDELTPANNLYLHAWLNSAITSVDNTHLNNYGAKEVAYLIAMNAPAELVPYVKTGFVEPTTADLIVNPDYVEPSSDDLKGDDLNSILWTTTSPWHGTVFGDIGGEGKLYFLDGDGVADYTKLAEINGVSNFAITENADGSVNLRASHLKEDNVTVDGSGFGKIAGSSDGIVMYYQAVDSAQNFSISAKAHVNGVWNANNQVSFGAIVADKIEVDKYDVMSIGNYVAAGPLKMLTTVGSVNETTGNLITAWGGYARINDTLTAGATIDSYADIPQPGDDIDVKITKVGNEYTVQYGKFTSNFTVELTDQAYVGVYVARCADVTFSDINFNNEVTE